LSPDQDATIALKSQGQHGIIDAIAESKALIDTAIGIQSANAIVRKRIETGERPGNNNAAIGLKNRGSYFSIGARTGIEGGVERTIKVETCDPTARDAVGESETAGSNHFSVRLRNDDIDGVVCSRRGDERGIDTAGRGRRRWGRDNGAAETEEEKEKKARKRRAMHLLKRNISSW